MAVYMTVPRYLVLEYELEVRSDLESPPVYRPYNMVFSAVVEQP